MKTIGTALLVLLLGVSTYAQVIPPKTMKVKVAIGLGYQICPARQGLPSLDIAFLCSGMTATPETVEVELTNMPAAKPEWLFYEGAYNTSLAFNDVTVTLETSVMYAKANGTTSAYVDGRLISTKNGVASQPVYFRASAVGGFANLTYSSTYGAMIPYPIGKQTSEFSPYMTITAPTP